MDPYVLKMPPALFNEDESDYYHDKGISVWDAEYDALGRDVVGIQKSRVSTWVNECLQRKISDEIKREAFAQALWRSEKVFQVTHEDIELFKQMINEGWRRSQMYTSREDFYAGYVDDYRFYLKVRLALRAGNVVIIKWV